MTKYVLNSGGINNEPERAKRFFAEVVSGLGNQPKILLCFFAQKREDWESKFANDKVKLQSFMPDGVRPQWVLAFPETFEKQIQESDVLYIHGGDDHLVQYWLRQFDLPRIWEGKVVATNSASSHALSKYFWTCDWRMCMAGLGILPIKFLAHYESSFGTEDPRGPIDWEKAFSELESFGDPAVSTHALREGEYVVIEK